MIRTPLLFLNVLVVATCGLIYELVAGTVASFVLGDSVRQFSLCIGVYLFALGMGAWLSRYVKMGLARAFIEVELGVALLGGFSAPLLFFSYARLSYFHVILFGLLFLIGVLVGLELPLLMRILKEQLDFSDLISKVLTFDYIGALFASICFPIFLVPHLGLIRTSIFFGILNGIVGLWGTWILQPILKKNPVLLRVRASCLLLLLVVGFIKSDKLLSLAEEELYPDAIVYAQTTPYQRIHITQGGNGFQLFLNSNLQFNSRDEYRYHEALVHPAMLSTKKPRRVLVMGGGDGLALREILKYESVESVTLVDLDPAMTSLWKHYKSLAELNKHSYDDPRVTVINNDAFVWLGETSSEFDLAIVDFPDPTSFSLGKLYSRRFFRMLFSRLTDDAPVAIQCTSPFQARQSYWCILNTMKAAGFHVHAYHAAVPSFGVWGFALAKKMEFTVPTEIPDNLNLRYLNSKTLPSLFQLPKDLQSLKTEINTLNNQALVRYYEEEWNRWK